MDWQGTLKVLAPTVATALLGPLGGAAVSALGTALGIDRPTQEAIGKAIASGQMTPEQVANLKALEMQYQNDEAERNFKYADLVFQDRASAREREIAVKDKMPAILAVLILGAAMVVSYMVFQGDTVAFKDPATAATAGTIVGYIFGELKAAFAYYFGTTSSGQTKHATISDIAKAP